MKPKTLLILSVAAGLLAVVLVQVQLRREKGETMVVFRATESVEEGDVIGNRYEEVTLPGAELFPNILKEAPTREMAEFVASTPLRRSIRAGEVVLFRHLEGTVDPGLRSQVPPGMRAVSIEVDEESAVAYMVEPGDTVDVLAALPMRTELPALSSSAGPPPPIVRNYPMLETRTLLQAVTVLAVGRRYSRTEAPQLDRRGGYSTVTLLVTPEGAKKLAYASDVLDSALTLALRNPEDEGREESAGAVSLSVAGFDRIGNG